MSNGQIMVVLIVLIVSITGLLKSRYRARDQSLDNGEAMPPALPSANEAELQREVQSLRERIKVLERIATEERRSSVIAAEIESLRDR